MQSEGGRGRGAGATVPVCRDQRDEDDRPIPDLPPYLEGEGVWVCACLLCESVSGVSSKWLMLTQQADPIIERYDILCSCVPRVCTCQCVCGCFCMLSRKPIVTLSGWVLM